MSSDNIVSTPPLIVSIIDNNGMISKPWAIWFRDVYKRTAYKGGNSIDDNKAATDASIESINDELLTIGAGAEVIIEAINTNELTMNNHISLESAHGADGDIVGFNDSATEALNGLVKMMGLVSDAVNSTASTVSVTSPDATTAPAAYDQAQVETIVVLANELKTDTTQLVSDLNTVVSEVNTAIAKINEILASSKTSGQMNSV